MASMNISLPGAMQDWVERQMKTGRFDNASEYMCDLTRHDQNCTSKIAAVQHLVNEAMASESSGKPLVETRAIARAQAQTQAQRRLIGPSKGGPVNSQLCWSSGMPKIGVNRSQKHDRSRTRIRRLRWVAVCRFQAKEIHRLQCQNSSR